MMSYWFLIPAVIVGVAIGGFLMAICAAQQFRNKNISTKKWWEDE